MRYWLKTTKPISRCRRSRRCISLARHYGPCLHVVNGRQTFVNESGQSVAGLEPFKADPADPFGWL